MPDTFDRNYWVNHAFTLHQSNRLIEAQEIYQRVLKHSPNDFASMHMLGVLYQQLGELEKAQSLLESALDLGELTPEFHYNLGNVYLAQGKRGLAEARFLRALALNPHFELAKQQMLTLHTNTQKAKNGPLNKPANNKTGKGSKRIVTQKSSTALIQGLKAQEQGDNQRAIQLFKQVLTHSPKDWVALFSLGRLLVLGGNPAKGLELIDRQIAANPMYAPGFQMRATALDMLGRYEEAVSAIDDGIRIDPTDFDALNRKVVILVRLDCSEEAIRLLNVVLAIKPDHEQTLSNLGTVLNTNRQFSKAAEVFKRLLSVNPNHSFALGAWVYNKLHIADWTDYSETVAKLCREVQSGRPACLSLPMMSMSNDSNDHMKCAKLFAINFFRRSVAQLWSGEKYQHSKIKIAYVSADLREHPVGHLLAGVIERHDKNRFEIIGVSTGINDGSVLRARFKAAFDHFLDVSTLSDIELGRLVRSYEPDIVVDLAGYTQGSRTSLFIDRVAPIQVNYLGFPGTMGLDCMDYIIADPHTIPVGDESMFSESVAWLPDTYLPTDANLVVSEETPSRQACGLPEVGFVFCSFNHIFKLNPIIFDCWMRILKAVPDSMLWLSKPSPEAIENLRRNAEDRGVSADRLIFAGRVPKVADHLARYRNAGLFLDTLQYNAHTTAADAMFVGLPVLTCTGGAFPGRVATGLLHALGVPELACKSLEEYVQTAIALANGPARLSLLREKVAANRGKTPLFDTDLYTRNLEAAFQMMVDRQKAGLPPASFRVGTDELIPEPVSAR